ncbi:histidine phosphatase family protein [Nocardia callitridis]|uniref:Histidine phosphatase family protein n=1 Tax=Nocardia callitridis TaxID=648753 RepID=A0ABP9KY21_9NOCA
MLRLDLVSHGLTEAMRKARFPVDEPLTESGLDLLAESTPLRAERVFAGPERRTVETAVALGLTAQEDMRLRDLDAGAWRGGELVSLPEDELHAWLTDPTFRGHGGESVVDVIERTRLWMAQVVEQDASTIAVTHPAVVRSAMLITLDAPPKSFWRIDIPPGSVTRLHFRGQWTLHFTA